MANNTQNKVRILSILSDGKLKDGTLVAEVHNKLTIHRAPPTGYSIKAPSKLLLIRTMNDLYIPLSFHERQQHNKGITWVFTNPLAEGKLFTINDHNYKKLFEFKQVFQLSGREPNLTQQNVIPYPRSSGNEAKKERLKQVLRNLGHTRPLMTPQQFNNALNMSKPYVPQANINPYASFTIEPYVSAQAAQPAATFPAAQPAATFPAATFPAATFPAAQPAATFPAATFPAAAPPLLRTGVGDYVNPSAKFVLPDGNTRGGRTMRRTRRAKKSKRTTRRTRR